MREKNPQPKGFFGSLFEWPRWPNPNRFRARSSLPEPSTYPPTPGYILSPGYSFEPLNKSLFEHSARELRRDLAAKFLAASIRHEGHSTKRAAMIGSAIADADALLAALEPAPTVTETAAAAPK
jgi:hypothetical protein